jgi:hypothetical protein
VIWLNPLALFALASVAAPILIHILVQPRAERLAFPSLRFLQPTRLASLRRHLLEDAPMLAVRAAILAVAVGAVAGPVIVTAIRRQAWDRRIARAVVAEPAARVDPADEGTFRFERFTGSSLRDSIDRAVAWLERTPPARRELVVVGPLALGSVDATDIAAIPESVGIRFERRGDLPTARAVDGGEVIGPDSTTARRLTFAGPQTLVEETPAQAAATWPIDVIHAPDAAAAIDAAKFAVVSQRAWAPMPGRLVRLVVVQQAIGSVVGDAGELSKPWMADAAAHLARNDELQAAASRVPRGIDDPQLSKAPWHIVMPAEDGRPLVAVAGGANASLLVVSAAPAADVTTPILMRSITDAIASVPDLQSAEMLPIPDRHLQKWSRPAAPIAQPAADTLRHGDAVDDRRWLWAVALILIGVETWMRRSRTAARSDIQEEPARVA